MKIAQKKAADNSPIQSSTEFDEYILKLREAIVHENTAERLRAERGPAGARPHHLPRHILWH